MCNKFVQLQSAKPCDYHKKIAINIYYVDQKVIDRILSLYYGRQNLWHTVRFLCWIVYYQSNQLQPAQLRELYESINTRVDQMHEIDCILFKD